jgi:hypothetical protein
MSELVVEPWINEFGQKINPGDEVIFVGTAWKSTRIRKGVFAGVRYDTVTRHHYVKDANGNHVMEDIIGRDGKPTGRQRSKTEVKTTREVVSIRVDKVNRGKIYKYINGKYTKTTEDIFGVSTLPLKRVYKIGTTLSDLTDKSF